MTIQEFEKSVARTWNNKIEYKEQLLNAALGLGESGELQNLVKKFVFHADQSVTLEKVMDEAGDLFYYLFALLRLWGIHVEDVLRYNSKKLEKRYPDGFAVGGGKR